MEIGDSTTRTLSLAADGLLSSQLPPITSMTDSSAITGIRVYPDQESSDQIERTEGFLGKRTRSEALVASGAGAWTLPEVRVPWWNTKTDTLEYSILPSTTISVSSPNIEIPNVAPASAPAETVIGELPAWIVPVAAAGWAVAILLAIVLWRVKRVAQPLPPSENTEETLRPLMSALKASTAQNDASKSRDLLLRWASLHAGRPIRTLEAVRDVCSEELGQDLDALESGLYATNQGLWSGGVALYRAVAREAAWSTENSETDARRLYPTR